MLDSRQISDVFYLSSSLDSEVSPIVCAIVSKFLFNFIFTFKEHILECAASLFHEYYRISCLILKQFLNTVKNLVIVMIALNSMLRNIFPFTLHGQRISMPRPNPINGTIAWDFWFQKVSQIIQLSFWITIWNVLYFGFEFTERFMFAITVEGSPRN
jgi:hypothetical protein